MRFNFDCFEIFVRAIDPRQLMSKSVGISVSVLDQLYTRMCEKWIGPEIVQSKLAHESAITAGAIANTDACTWSQSIKNHTCTHRIWYICNSNDCVSKVYSSKWQAVAMNEKMQLKYQIVSKKWGRLREKKQMVSGREIDVGMKTVHINVFSNKSGSRSAQLIEMQPTATVTFTS